MTGAPTRKPGIPRWFTLASLAALLLRGALLWEYRDSPFAANPVGDELHYWAWAGRIASGEWRPTEVFYQGPLFPYFLALLKTAFPAFGQLHLSAFQLLVNWITCLLYLPLLRRWAEERVALTAAVLALFFSPAVFFALKGVSNTIGLFLIVAGLVALPHEGKGWLPRAILSGMLFGTAVLAIPSSILLPGAAALFLFLRLPVKRRALPPAILLVSVLLVLSPVTITNYRQDGSLTPVSADFGEVFLQGNNPQATGVYSSLGGFSSFVADERRDAARIARGETGRFLNESGISRHFFSKGLDFVVGHPWQWLILEARKACLLLGGLDVPHEFSMTRERRDFLSLLWAFPVGGLPVVLLASLGLAARETRQRLLLPLAGACAFGAICLIFYVANRFTHPFYFLLLPVAAAGLLSLPKLAGHPVRAVALLPCLIAASFAGLWLRNPYWETGYLAKLVVAYEDSRDFPSAERTLRRMVEADPRSPLAYELMGMIYHRHGDPETALWSLERSIELDPANPGPRYGRAWLLRQSGRYEEALEEMTRVLELDPFHPEAPMARIGILEALGRGSPADDDPIRPGGRSRLPRSR